MSILENIFSSSSGSPTSYANCNAAVMPANFAFLNHSQQTIPQRLPPSVDNKPLARQKRRRTSPEDAAILEAEFRRDPNPDKSERGRIAHRVALGEKEVQIWFQNRRSTTRRRARPLTPPTTLGGSQGNVSTSPISSNELLNTGPTAIHIRTYAPLSPQPRGTIQEHGYSTKDDGLRSSTSGTTAPALASPSGSPKDEIDRPSMTCGPTRCSTRKDIEAISGVLGTCAMDGILHGQVDESKRLGEPGNNSGITLQRSQSGVRLSMNSRGLATILGDSEASPSPPKMRAGLEDLASTPPGLRRSFSAATIGGSLPSGSVTRTRSSNRRIWRGRSRDSRAWEFWCDGDSRNDLAKKAEQESTGSAADAISLMRSTSRNALTPIQDKRNHQGSRSSVFKRSQSGAVSKPRPNIANATSAAQLRSGAQGVPKFTGKNVKEMTDEQGIPVFEFGNSDSDKENREPVIDENTIDQPNSDAKQQTTARRPMLRESCTAPALTRCSDVFTTQSQALKRARNSHTDESKENIDVCDEVARFMQSGRDDACQSDDLVVQGLLSLSQGAWR